MEILNIKYEMSVSSMLFIDLGIGLGIVFLLCLILSALERNKIMCAIFLCIVIICVGIVILGCNLPLNVYYECTVNDIQAIENDWQIVEQRGKIFVLEKTNSDAEAQIPNDKIIYEQQEK